MPPLPARQIRTILPLVAGLLLPGASGWARPKAVDPGKPATADLYLSLEDTAAAVVLDGKSLARDSSAFAGSGELALEGLKPGKHRIEARSPHRIGTLDITLKPGELRHVRIRMRRSTAPIRVLSWPQEAQVFQAEACLGRTPLRIDSLPEGRHTLTLRLPGHLDTTFILDTDSRRKVQVRMVPAGNLVIEPENGIELFLIRGAQSLTRPANGSMTLAAGIWQVRSIHPDWIPLDTSVAILPGKTTSLAMKRLWARLSVVAKPAADAWLDGKPLGSTPLLLDTLVPGAHRLVLRSRGYREQVRELRLAPGEALLVKLDLDSLEGREPAPRMQGFEEE